MGRIVSLFQYEEASVSGFMRPIVFCCNEEAIANLDRPIESINVRLASELLDMRASSRARKIEACFEKLVGEMPPNPIVKDIDVLFNPDYKIDVLRMLISAYRAVRFDVLWPGMLNGNELRYAQEGFPDYHSYSISDYDITCVK